MNSAKGIVLLGTCVLMMSAPGYAQNAPPAELSFGYNYLQVAGADNSNAASFPAGWYGEIAGNVSSAIALVGQATGNYKSVGVQGIDVDVAVHTFGGGVRFIGRGQGASPFGQVLLGVVRGSGSSNLSGLLPFVVSESANGAFLQLGAGVNLLSNAPLGLRIGADYTRMSGDNDTSANTLRFALGIVLPIGR